MKLFLGAFLLLITFTNFANAQSQVVSASKIAWDQDAPTVVEAQGYTYKYYPDGFNVGNPLTNVTCAGNTSPFVCNAPFPPFVPGSHSIEITASNLAGESLKSNSLAFLFVVTPAIPRSLRIAA